MVAIFKKLLKFNTAVLYLKLEIGDVVYVSHTTYSSCSIVMLEISCLHLILRQSHKELEKIIFSKLVNFLSF